MTKSFENPELKLAYEFVQFTGNNIFLTGKAGTGKTTFLHNLKKVSSKRMIVTAPTGVAAINAGGVTIHSFFQMPFGPNIPSENARVMAKTGQKEFPGGFHKFSRDKVNIIKSLDLLVIDEISMVRADLLDGIDEVLRRYRDRNKPFGGVQLLMIGDLQQLAPVVTENEWTILKDYYETVFFFGSRALQKTKFVSIELKFIFRQSDSEFIDILNKIRENKIDPDALSELNKKYNPNFHPGEAEGYITLTTHNLQAKKINESRLEELPGKIYRFSATIDGEFPEYSFPTEPELSLKKGAQVMFVKNDSSRDKLYYNGKIGTIVKFEDDLIFVKCPGESSPIPVDQVEWQNTKYSLNENTKEIQESIAGTFVQYPLKLAWAITIHKSQGLTFEKAIIDARAAFAHGQVYVALSRCKSLDGLVLSTPISNPGIISDSGITSFISEIEKYPPGQEHLTKSKMIYQLDLLLELFDFSVFRYRISYLIKSANEHKESISGDLSADLDPILQSVNNEIINVAEKFTAQLQRLNTGETEIEENLPVQERVQKACIYFTEKIQTSLVNPLQGLVFETDNKTVRKTIMSGLEKLYEVSMIKLSCLKVSRNGFKVMDYLEARAKATLEKNAFVPQREISSISPKTSVSNPVLLARLKEWRKKKSAELNLPAYMVLQQKTMLELAGILPEDTAELKTITGIGKRKLTQFGAELLEIIAVFRNEK